MRHYGESQPDISRIEYPNIRDLRDRCLAKLLWLNSERGETKKPPGEEAFCDPAGTRTQDHYIKSVMLYQLSYGIVKRAAKII